MRTDAAAVLIAMDYVLDLDFVATQDGPDVRVDWLSERPMPSEEEIEAFDMSPEAIETREDTKEPLLADLNAQASGALTAIDNYLANADSATAAQVRAEVKAIDQRQKQIIKTLKRLVERTWR